MKLYEIIDQSPVGKWVSKKQQIIEQTDPQKIYVENIRSFFGTKTSTAKKLCDFAVRQKKLTKHIGYYCPNPHCEKLLFSELYGNTIKQTELTCINCEIRGEEDFMFNKSNLETIIFYRLVKDGE